MTPPNGTARRSGRRPGDSGTRQAILRAAARLFAEQGYDRTSLRQIALTAGVDPTLVTHFYGSKQQLFVTAVDLPYEPAEILSTLLGGEPAAMGHRLARFILDTFEAEGGRRHITGLVRAAATEAEAARLVRDLLTSKVLKFVVDGLGTDDAPLRAALLGVQTVGLVMARYIVAVEPLASLPPETVAAVIAPILQHILTAPLTQLVTPQESSR